MKIINKYRYPAVVGNPELSLRTNRQFTTRNLFQMSQAFCCIVLLIAFFLSITSCKKLLEIDPPKEKLDAEVVFSSDLIALTAMSGIYTEMIAGQFHFASGGYFASVVVLAGMSADELRCIDPAAFFNIERNQFAENSLLPENSILFYPWQTIYKSIYQCNSMLEGLDRSSSLSEAVKKQFRGECLFIRAFSHFYAFNLYGKVPVITSTNYLNNASTIRMPEERVLQQIVSDLVEAKALLSANYVRGLNLPATDRIRVNKYAAAALLARVYLYTNEWVKAEDEASEVISNNSLFSLNTELNNVFLAHSSSNQNKEAIWQLMPLFGGNTQEGVTFILNSSVSSTTPYILTDQLVNSFEPGDSRKVKWINNFGASPLLYYPYKFKISGGSAGTEYSMVLRLAEQCLIRAEARIQQNKIAEGVADLNVLRARARTNPGDLPDISAGLSKADAMLAVEQERRVELFCEWGHRWFDLKRWGRATAVLGPIKGANWQATDVLYPLPQSEMDRNPNLRPQNPGY